MPSSHLILCHPLLLPPSIFPSIRVLSNESVLLIRWPNYWSFSISPSNEYSGLISFRMDWLDLLAVQRTLKSLLQHHSSKASILQCSAFYIIHISHPYMTTGKTIALTRRAFVSKVISLLFNMLSKLVITFLPRSKHLLISWLQSPSAVILEPKKIKSVTVSPTICHEVTGPDAMILVFWMLSFKPTYSLSSFTFIRRLFSSSSLSAIRVVSSSYLRLWYFSQQSWFQLVLHPVQHFFFLSFFSFFFFFLQLITVQSFIWQAKKSTPSRHKGGLTPKERPQSILASSFYKFVSSQPWACPMQIGLAMKRVYLFHLKFSLWSADILSFSFLQAFPFLCLLATAILDSFFLF